MTISLVVNTCAAGPGASTTLSSGKVPYSWRAYALQNFILPRYLDDPNIDEIIVVGEWKPAPRNEYQYIEVPSEAFNCTDALAQRHAGCEAASGDWIICSHDDHILASDWYHFFSLGNGGNVISPARRTRLRAITDEPLNNGRANGYVNGHCAIYQRAALQAAPWSAVPKVFTWDKAHTQQLLDAGETIDFDDSIVCYDVEYGASPWR